MHPIPNIAGYPPKNYNLLCRVKRCVYKIWVGVYAASGGVGGAGVRIGCFFGEGGVKEGLRGS